MLLKGSDIRQNHQTDLKKNRHPYFLVQPQTHHTTALSAPKSFCLLRLRRGSQVMQELQGSAHASSSNGDAGCCNQEGGALALLERSGLEQRRLLCLTAIYKPSSPHGTFQAAAGAEERCTSPNVCPLCVPAPSRSPGSGMASSTAARVGKAENCRLLFTPLLKNLLPFFLFSFFLLLSL